MPNQGLQTYLNISLSELLGERTVVLKLPVEYLNLKYQLMHATSLDKPNNLMKLDEKLARLLGDTSLADIISEKMRDAMKE